MGKLIEMFASKRKTRKTPQYYHLQDLSSTIHLAHYHDERFFKFHFRIIAYYLTDKVKISTGCLFIAITINCCYIMIFWYVGSFHQKLQRRKLAMVQIALSFRGIDALIGRTKDSPICRAQIVYLHHGFI